MRILKIGILNLNSLRGEQTIDFTASPLSDHQLYAIVGPTGAGKTTILDAITLALYGQTERNKAEKDRKDGSGSIMSYGAGECRAELEYETATGRYRNVWHRQRAHKKPEKDLTASRREINKWNPKTEEWDMLASKKREVDEETEKVVGLDYERFVRSVMLTQGDFARFLKSSPGEKAAILEKITGTEIYKDLSVAAFTRAKLAREAYERAVELLSMAPPLETELREGLEKQQLEKQAESNTASTNIANLLGKLDLYQKVSDLAKQQVEAAQENERLTAGWEAMSTDRDRLVANDKLEPYRASIVRNKQLTKEQEALSIQDKEVSVSLEKLTLRQKELSAATAVVQARRKDFDDKLSGREEKFGKASVLETSLTELTRDQAGEEATLAKFTTSKSDVDRQLKIVSEAIKSLETKLGGRSPEALELELKQLETAVPQREKTLREVVQSLEAARLKERLLKEQAAQTALTGSMATATSAEAEAVVQFTKAQASVDDAIILRNGLVASKNLHEHKHDLEPGEECPVCGATEHPALATYVPVTDSRIQTAEVEVSRLRQELSVANGVLEKNRTGVREQNRRHDAGKVRVEELAAQLTAYPTSDDRPVKTLLEVQENLEHQLTKDKKSLSALQALRTELPRLSEASANQKAFLARQQELATEVKTLTETTMKRKTLLSGKQAEKEALIGKHSVEQCRRMIGEKDETLRRDLATAQAAERAEIDQLAAATERLKVLREQLAKLSTEQAALSTKLEAGFSKLSISAETATTSLLPVESVNDLRNKVGKLKQLIETAKTMRQNVQGLLTAAEAAVKGLPDLLKLKQEKEELDHAAKEVNQIIGAINLQIKQDDERIQQNAAKRKEIEGLKKATDRWERLNGFIGSADGKKFRSYAQAITLQQLIEIGNGHLASINPRYRMEYDAPETGAPERLEMIIIDQYQNDNRRTMATLSGGESFLISLALALGLSDLASGKQLIQSLFIDEGFGTLDGKTLDQAMTTLEQLQAQGKTIGLISHVPQLRERIYCQIELQRVGDGFSQVRIQG